MSVRLRADTTSLGHFECRCGYARTRRSIPACMATFCGAKLSLKVSNLEFIALFGFST
jgi:hypothetical protein